MSITQLNPPIPIYIPDTDETGLAHFIIDEGLEHHLYWVIFLDKNGECWTLPNTRIKAQKNITVGRFICGS